MTEASKKEQIPGKLVAVGRDPYSDDELTPCFVWDGTAEALKTMLDRAGTKIVEGPVPRQGGRRAAASSVYVRDPDGNLLEFMIYT